MCKGWPKVHRANSSTACATTEPASSSIALVASMAMPSVGVVQSLVLDMCSTDSLGEVDLNFSCETKLTMAS